jgi:Peptidase family M28/PDZ domain
MDTTQVRRDIAYLASDELAGRAPGTQGERLAQRYIAARFKALGLQPRGEHGYLQSFTYHMSSSPHDTLHLSGKKTKGSNVLGYLDNGAAYTIVIGAHYDHLGTDGRGSSLDPNPKGKIHHGADDNASGTAGVMALAEQLVNNGVKERYNYLFMCFSAEEAGLIGSKYFTNHATVPLASVSAMINMDMVGRFNDSTRKLIVYGTGTSDVWEQVLAHCNHDRFVLKQDSAGVGPSDQTSFYLKDIPVLFFFTGQHSDYHKPSDEVAKINAAGEVKVLNYIAEILDSLNGYPKLKFQKTVNNEGKKSSFKVTLGIMPDYSYDKGGVRIDGVTDNKPAAKAGMLAGDIVIRMGDLEIKDIYAYMAGLNKYKKGDQAAVTIQRGAERKVLMVEF